MSLKSRQYIQLPQLVPWGRMSALNCAIKNIWLLDELDITYDSGPDLCLVCMSLSQKGAELQQQDAPKIDVDPHPPLTKGTSYTSLYGDIR